MFLYKKCSSPVAKTIFKNICGAEIVISFYIDLVFALENMYVSPFFSQKL
jgi:hypothetical protein